MKLRTCPTCEDAYQPVNDQQTYCSRPCTPCGTYAGYIAHKRHEEPVDPACRAAATAYAKQRREDPEVRRRERGQNNARFRALWRLAKEHHARYLELVAEEKAR